MQFPWSAEEQFGLYKIIALYHKRSKDRENNGLYFSNQCFYKILVTLFANNDKGKP